MALLPSILGTLIYVLSCKFVFGAPPVVSDLPIIRYVGEQEVGSRLLYVYTIVDPDADAFTCTNNITALQGTATGTEFDLRQNSQTLNYELYVVAASACCTFNYATTQNYENNITCIDAVGQSTSQYTLTATVVDNERVTLNNAATDLAVNALGTGNEVTLKTMTATSLLGHDLQFINLTSNPSFSPEFFKIIPSTGEIKSNREMKFLDKGTQTVYLTLTLYDSVDQILVYAVQTVNMNNQNTIPTTSTLPANSTRLETLAVGTVLFTVSVTDDASNTHTFRHTCVPPGAADTFTIDTNGNYALAGGGLDYESIPTYTCSIYIHDGCHEGGPFIYKLDVTNDNEAPSFSTNMYFATTVEAAAGAVSFTPGFTCTDPDAGDTTTYEFKNFNNSDRFAVSSATATKGIMTFAIDYDVDNSAMPSTVVLTVCCVDSGNPDGNKLTGTAQVTITINDANDNEPTFGASAYTITVDQYTTVGSVIGTITPNDIDSGSNAALTCTGTSANTFSSYVSIGQDCNVRLAKAIDFANGQVIQYTMLAKDDGTPQLTGTAAVDVVYSETTTTTTTTQSTTTEYNFFDHGENIAMFVLLLLAALALLGLLTWCLLKMCMGGRCGSMCDCLQGRSRGRKSRYPPRQVTPQTPPRSKYRPPTPEYRQSEPPRRQGVFTVARPPMYSAVRPVGQIIQPVPVSGVYR